MISLSSIESLCPATEHVCVAEDRSISVPAGKRVIADYVPIDQVMLGCRDRMAIGDVDIAYRRRLQLGWKQAQPWPPPRGHWLGDRFVIDDGRHEFVAALMLGQEYLLCAWIEV